MPHTAQIMSKYKLTWKDLTATDFKTYLLAMFKAFIPKKKIKNLDELETFIQTPISTTIDPVASDIGKPAPIAAAIGSSIS